LKVHSFISSADERVAALMKGPGDDFLLVVSRHFHIVPFLLTTASLIGWEESVDGFFRRREPTRPKPAPGMEGAPRRWSLHQVR
jgi:hypothetical protein